MMPIWALADIAAGAGPDLLPSFWRAGFAILVVAGILAAALWALRRHAPALRGKRTMSIESALALGERRSLAIVSVEGRRLLVGLAPGQVSLVTELRPAASFTDAIERAMRPDSGEREA
jgi:flagellar biogenesis protein FliO